MEMVRVQTRLY